MPELRQNFATKEWVIIATERAKRPEEMATHRPPRNPVSFSPKCPFCPGNESITPPEVMRIPANGGGAWNVRVVPNKFAALSRDAGMPASAFLDRMEDDFMLIRAFPNELRWFVHDSDDESFLLHEARDVFDHPAPAEDHRRAFLHACVDRMASADLPDTDTAKPTEPVAAPGKT